VALRAVRGVFTRSKQAAEAAKTARIIEAEPSRHNRE